jgi:hypothetical protein
MTKKEAQKESKEHKKALKPLLKHLKEDENKIKPIQIVICSWGEKGVHNDQESG